MKRLKIISLFTEFVSVRPIVAAAAILFVLDFIYVNYIYKYPDPVFKNPSEKTMEVEGKIRGMNYDKEGNLYAVIVDEYLCYVNYASEGVRDRLSYGDTVYISGSGDAIESPMNPGEFDRRRYYAADHVFFSMNAKDIKLLKHRAVSVRNVLTRGREYVKEKVLKFCPVSAGTINAILLSEKNDLDEYRKSIYRYAGIGHFLVISGLHISALGSFVYLSLRKGKLSIKASGTVALTVLFLYGAFVEFSVSVVRAIIMFTVRLVADMTGNSYDMMNAVGFSSVVSILMNPFWIMNTGFVYSYATVTIISVYITCTLRNTVSEGFLGNIRNLVKLPIILFVFMLPINLLLSYESSLSSVITNSILMPLSAPLLLAAFLACISSVAGFDFCASAFDFAVSALLKLFDGLCVFFSGIRLLAFLGRPMLFKVILFYGISFYILVNGRKIGRGIKFFIILCLIQFLSGRIFYPNVSMLCVGQGDCSVIRTGKRSAVVIDCGSSDKADVAGKILVPYLKYNGIDTIDALFISHSDMDHCGGASYILSGAYSNSNVFTGIKVKRLIIPYVGESEDNHILFNLSKEAQVAGIEAYRIKAGDIIDINDWKFFCAWPDVERLSGDSNEDSMMLLASYGDFDVLFTGDAPKEKELCALAYLSDINRNPVEVLKVSHHGSKTASSQDFLDAIGAKTATISAGRNNRYGHPHKETLNNLKKVGYEIFRTDSSGLISIDIHKSDYVVTCECY